MIQLVKRLWFIFLPHYIPLVIKPNIFKRAFLLHQTLKFFDGFTLCLRSLWNVLVQLETRLEPVCRASGSQDRTSFIHLESQAWIGLSSCWEPGWNEVLPAGEPGPKVQRFQCWCSLRCWVVYLSRAWHTVFFTIMHTFLPRNVQHFFSSFSIHFFRYPIPRLALLRKLGRTSCPISEPDGATSSRRPVGDEKAKQIQHRSKRTTTAMLLFIISSTS